MKNAPTDEVMDQTDDNCNLYTAVFPIFSLYFIFYIVLIKCLANVLFIKTGNPL